MENDQKKRPDEEITQTPANTDEQMSDGRKEQIETAGRSLQDGMDDEDLEDLNSMKGNKSE